MKRQTIHFVAACTVCGRKFRKLTRFVAEQEVQNHLRVDGCAKKAAPAAENLELFR